MGKHAEGTAHSPWPYASLLLLGFFGARSPGGVRFSFESITSALVMGYSMAALTAGASSPFPPLFWALMLPACALSIVLALFRYLRGLDELSRTIQLQALAVGYGTALTLGMAMIGLLLAAPAGTAAGLHPVVWFVPVFIAETSRGIALVVFARRYA